MMNVKNIYSRVNEKGNTLLASLEEKRRVYKSEKTEVNLMRFRQTNGALMSMASAQH